jgi:hypothetical protein
MLVAALAAALDWAMGERLGACVEDEGLLAVAAWDTTIGVRAFGGPIAPGLEDVAGAADSDSDAVGGWLEVAGCSAGGRGWAALEDSEPAPAGSAVILRAAVG